MGHQHRCGEQRKAFQKVAKRPFEPTSDTGQCHRGLVPRARTPAVTPLEAGRMGSDDDLRKAKQLCKSEDLEFKRQHINTR